MATGTYAPDPDLHVVDANGLPVNGGLVWTYLAGTTTLTPTYTDVGLTVPNTNPIVAGSDGRFVAFLVGGTSYKFVYETAALPPAHGAVLATRDNILAVTTIVPGTGGGVVQSTSLSGTVNDFALVPGCSILYCENNGTLTFTGFSGGVAGQRLTIMGHGNVVYVAHNNSGSLVQNRLINWATSAPTPIAPPTQTFGSVTYINSGSRWEIVGYEQGEWLTAPFSAANFFGSAGMTWTVDAVDVGRLAYRLNGRTLTVQIYLGNTSISGTPSTNLSILNSAWGGFLPSNQNAAANNTRAAACAEPGSSFVDATLNTYANSLYFLKAVPASWALSTNGTVVQGQISFEVS